MPDRWLRLTTAPAWFFLVLFAVYAATAHYGGEVSNDVHATAHASWNLATNGTLDMSGLDLPYEQAWTVQVGDAEYSNRFPGVILAGTLFYLLLQPSVPLVAPSALAACLASAVGVTAMLVALRRMLPPRWAWAAAGCLALGTGVWAVAADGLYTHGVTTMWLGALAAGVVLGPRCSWLVVTGAAMSVLTRPHLSVALACTAVVMWRHDRRSAVAVLTGIALGSAAFVLYGRVLFETWSPMGPYQVYDHSRAVEDDPSVGSGPVLWRLENAALAFVAPRVGLLPAYPALVLVGWALIHRRTPLPTVPCARGIAGVAYLAVAVGVTRVSGGSGFWGNRTLIESVVLSWPLAGVLLAQHVGGRVWRWLLAACIAWSVAFHGLGAMVPSPAPTVATDDAYEQSTVMFWQVPQGLREADAWQVVLVCLLAVAAAWLTCCLTAGARAEPPSASSGGPAGPDTRGSTSAQGVA